MLSRNTLSRLLFVRTVLERARAHNTFTLTKAVVRSNP